MIIIPPDVTLSYNTSNSFFVLLYQSVSNLNKLILSGKFDAVFNVVSTGPSINFIFSILLTHDWIFFLTFSKLQIPHKFVCLFLF